MKKSLDIPRSRELLAASLVSLAMVALILAVQFLSEVDSSDSTPIVEHQPIAVFPDFASINNVEVKKQQFFDFLQDYIVAENSSITSIREELRPYIAIANSGVAFSARERMWVLNLAEDYRIESAVMDDREIVNELMLRVDVIPLSLALAQAANESAWGTSRFTLEGNNIFGQWCYEEGCGIVPARRRSGATHEVESFESVESSVQAYILNINTHPSYEYLRQLRAEMRQQERQLDPMELAYGLGDYSERGDSYVDEVQNIIIQNDLRSRSRKLIQR
ncbi:MAG: glucosaminidase domain-containing protein [Proteobacteria bacterium]|nr:glucosaminidase domain-containing protein [Pseudomonadota bacterium]